MNLLDLYEGREPYQQAIDKLEQRRIEDLEARMDDCARRGDKEGFQKCKAERDSYYKIKEGEVTKTATGIKHRGTYGTEYSKSGVEFAKQKHHADLNKVDKTLTKNLEKGMDIKMDEGSMKQWLWNEAERMDRDAFVANADEYGMTAEEAAEWWDSINGVDEASIGQDIVNKSEKMARATPQTKAGAVTSTVKNAAKWLAGKGGPGQEGPTYESTDPLRQKLGNIINKSFGKIYNYGDDGLDYLDRAAPTWFDLFGDDQYNNDIDTIIAQAPIDLLKISAQELTDVLSDLKSGMVEGAVAIAEKLKGLPTKKLGSARDLGKSVRKFRAQRGLEEAGTDSQWSKEGDWKAIPKAKSGKPADPRGEVTHLSDVARREAERKADQKKNSEEVEEGWSDKSNPVPYGVYINGRQWKEFPTDDHARAVADKLSAKLKAEGSDKKVTIAPSESYMKKLGEDDPMGGATVDIDQMAGADADTNPGNLGEAGSPAQQAAIAIAMKKAHKKPKTDEALRDPWKEKHFGPGKVVQKVFKVKADNGKSYNIKAATEHEAKETFQKHAPDANILSIKFVSNVMNEAGDRVDPILYKALDRMQPGIAGQGQPGDDLFSAARTALATEWGLMALRSEYATATAYTRQLIDLYLAKHGAKQGVAEDHGSWIVYDPETKQIKKRFKTHTAGKSYARTHGLGFASSEYYFDNIKQPAVAEAQTDYQKRRQRERDVDAGKPVAKQRQSKMTDYQKRRAQDKKDMELGEDQDTSGVESAIIRRIMVSHLDWLQKFGPEKVMQAAEEVAYNVGDVDEIGTSDVSAYVHEVGQILGVDQ